MKKIIVSILVLMTISYLPLASAESIKINALHRGYSGITKLKNQTLYLQITPNEHIYVDTNKKGVFELSTAYEGKEIRAYLVRKIDDEYTVVGGCFSAFVPVNVGEVSLKGISCLDMK